MRSRGGIPPAFVLLAALACASPPARAGDPLADLLKSIEKERDADRRCLLASRLALSDDSRAAERLARLLREDPEPAVRVAAASGLARMTFDGVEDGLAALLARGGIREVRGALAAGLGSRENGWAALDRGIRAAGGDSLGRALLVRALGSIPGDAARGRLLTLLEGDDPLLRAEALRALSAREDMTAERWSAVLPDLLRRRRDLETLMAALDVMETLRDPALLPSVEALGTFLDPAMKEAVAHLRALLRMEAWKRLAEKASRDGYGPPPPPREGEPPPRTRMDLVFVVDATGSLAGCMERIRRWIRDRCAFLVQQGCDVRVGIVAYRDNPRAAVPRIEVLPLTHDAEACGEFLDALAPAGADSRGASVHLGLEEALDRMSWRWDGVRSVYLVADSRCGDPERARRVVSIHRSGDGTRTHVLYLLRTRGKVPEDILGLAAAAGGAVEILE